MLLSEMAPLVRRLPRLGSGLSAWDGGTEKLALVVVRIGAGEFGCGGG